MKKKFEASARTDLPNSLSPQYLHIFVRPLVSSLLLNWVVVAHSSLILQDLRIAVDNKGKKGVSAQLFDFVVRAEYGTIFAIVLNAFGMNGQNRTRQF